MQCQQLIAQLMHKVCIYFIMYAIIALRREVIYMEDKKLSEYIGNKIKSLRKEKNITQNELGKRIGVKNNTISAYERGAISTDQDVLFKLADVFGVSINDFFPYDEVAETRTPYVTTRNFPYFPTAISAGLPLTVDGVTETSTISVSSDVLGKYSNDRDIFFARINGDSMDKLMQDNTLIAIKPIPLTSLNNGDIVVFSTDHEYSVKHYYRYGDALVFKPNSHDIRHKEQEYSINDNITIHGKVITYIINLD